MAYENSQTEDTLLTEKTVAAELHALQKDRSWWLQTLPRVASVAIGSSFLIWKACSPQDLAPFYGFGYSISVALVLSLINLDTKYGPAAGFESRRDRGNNPLSSLFQICSAVVLILSVPLAFARQVQSMSTSLLVSALLKGLGRLGVFAICTLASPIQSLSMNLFSIAVFCVFNPPTSTSGVAGVLSALIFLALTIDYIPSRAPKRNLLIGFALLPVLGVLYRANQSALVSSLAYDDMIVTAGRSYGPRHPIEDLFHHGNIAFTATISRQSKTLHEAVREYRRRYKRPPPDGFDKWYNIAVQNHFTLIDEFDGLYEGLEPLWGLSPYEIKARVDAALEAQRDTLLKVEIKNNNVTISQDHSADWLGVAIKGFLENQLLEFLPDMTLAFNTLDEPRVAVPHDTLHSIAQNIQPLSTRVWSSKDRLSTGTTVDFFDGSRQRAWDFSTLSCPVDSPSRWQEPEDASTSDSAIRFLSASSNSSNVCMNPRLKDTHGFFVSPNHFYATQDYTPIFSPAKPSSFQDVLYPNPYYLSKVEQGDYIESEDPVWEVKTNNLYWTGSTTGGFATTSNWHHLHRQRLVKFFNNRTAPILLLKDDDTAKYRWKAYRTSMETVADLFNVTFTGIFQCTEEACAAEHANLPFSSSRDSRLASLHSRYVLDMDGNGLSGRFYRLLGSRSAVLKQTVFREWHDDWLFPWVHYIPISMGMEELPEVMRFLTETESGRDIGKRIAEEGRRWSREVLKKTDLEIAFFRLLLEYGRLVDPQRTILGCCD